MPEMNPRTIAYADPLAPCPFALPTVPHALEVVEIDTGIFAVCCNSCRTIGPHCDGAQSAAEAIEKWSVRGNMLQ